MPERLIEQEALQASLDFSSRVPDSYAVRKALQLLFDNDVKGVPAIRLYSRKPRRVGTKLVQTGAYVTSPQRDVIHVNDQTPDFRKAAGGDEKAAKALAAALAHEMMHVKNGPDEQAAYDEQQRMLGLLGLKNKVQAARDYALGQ